MHNPESQTKLKSNCTGGYQNQESDDGNKNNIGEKRNNREDRGGMRRRYQDLAEAQQKASILLNEHQIYKDIRKRNQVCVEQKIINFV